MLRSDPPQEGLNGLDAGQCLVRMLKGNFVNASSVVMRRSVLEDVGNFDETFPCLVDKELWLRLLNAGARFYYDSEVVVLYRVHPRNISKKTDLLLATRRRIIDKAEEFMQGNALFADIDWPSLKKEMQRHICREAAEAHFAQGRCTQALKYGSPLHSGVSRRSCALFMRSLILSIANAGHRADSRTTN